MPPIEKIYEAWSAVAQCRVKFLTPAESLCGQAKVTSSNGEKEYLVSWDNNTYASNDNATYWQRYPGYPVLAILMIQQKLPYSPPLAEIFRSVNWNAINKKAGRDYAKALALVCNNLKLTETQIAQSKAFAQLTLDALEKLGLTIKRIIKPKQCKK